MTEREGTIAAIEELSKSFGRVNSGSFVPQIIHARISLVRRNERRGRPVEKKDDSSNLLNVASGYVRHLPLSFFFE